MSEQERMGVYFENVRLEAGSGQEGTTAGEDQRHVSQLGNSGTGPSELPPL